MTCCPNYSWYSVTGSLVSVLTVNDCCAQNCYAVIIIKSHLSVMLQFTESLYMTAKLTVVEHRLAVVNYVS